MTSFSLLSICFSRRTNSLNCSFWYGLVIIQFQKSYWLCHNIIKTILDFLFQLKLNSHTKTSIFVSCVYGLGNKIAKSYTRAIQFHYKLKLIINKSLPLFLATPADNEADIALYVGVFVAVAFFIMIFIAMVMFIRRIKGRDPCMYRGSGTGKM